MQKILTNDQLLIQYFLYCFNEGINPCGFVDRENMELYFCKYNKELDRWEHINYCTLHFSSGGNIILTEDDYELIWNYLNTAHNE